MLALNKGPELKKESYFTIKVDFRTMNVTRHKEEHFKMSKNSVHQEDTRILNICVPHKRGSKYLQQRQDWRENQASSQLQWRDFNTCPLAVHSMSRQHIRKEIQELHNWHLYLDNQQNILFIHTCDGDQDHILGHKTTLYALERIEITQSITLTTTELN